MSEKRKEETLRLEEIEELCRFAIATWEAGSLISKAYRKVRRENSRLRKLLVEENVAEVE